VLAGEIDVGRHRRLGARAAVALVVGEEGQAGAGRRLTVQGVPGMALTQEVKVLYEP
jgi:hypothetical protein